MQTLCCKRAELGVCAASRAAAAAAAAAEAAKAKPAAKGKGAVEEVEVEPPKPLIRGECSLALQLPIDVAGRDWLRSGVQIKLFRTFVEATSKMTTYMKELEPPKKGPPLDPIEVTELVWSYGPYQTVCLGVGTLVDGALLEGQQEAQVAIHFETPDEPLFNEEGIRLTLKQVAGRKQRVGKVTATYGII